MPKMRVQIPKQVLGKKLDGEWIFLNLKNGQYYGLNETASLIWDELKAGKKHEEILERLQEIYEANRTVLEKDLKGLVKDLTREGLIKIENSSAKI